MNRKIAIVITALVMSCFFIAPGDSQTDKPAPKPAASKAAALPPGLPKDAVATSDGGWTSTDKNGKKWYFRNTPFGLSRSAYVEHPEPEVKASDPDLDVRVVDKGDSIQFERKGPMGPSIWTTKKSNLSADERRIIEKNQNLKPQNDPAQPNDSSQQKDSTQQKDPGQQKAKPE